MALLVQLACHHNLWPTGSVSLFKVGETAYCGTCRAHKTITSVGSKSW